MTSPFTPTYGPVPPGPLAGPLQLLPVNAEVVAVHTATGAHVGSLKKVGGVWKFKAMGYGADGGMEPGHGPLTDQHNMAFATPDAAEVSARLLGALSVLALLGVLIAQVVSGLLSDDEIAFSGPLTRFVSGEWVGRATWFHADVGQYLVIGLVALHLLAIAYYTLVRRKILVRPMLHGDKDLSTSVPASRDNALTRVAAALVLAACAALAWWVAGLGAV